MLPPPSEQALSQLRALKEGESRALQAQRCQPRDAALQDAHSQLHQAQGALRRLQEDFVYNLQVLEERDRELERYDAAFAQARGLEEARQAEVSELRVEAARLRQALAREARRREDLQRQHQLKLQEHRLELERIHSDKNSEMDQQREQYENLKWKLERRLEELDGELALQRKELLLEFESEMQKREHGFRLQADSMSNVVLTHELKVKLLNKELVALKDAAAQAAESLRSAEAANAGLEEKLQHSGQELRDLAAAKDARIKDLEGKLNCVQLSRKKEEEVFRRKHEELDHLARERDVVLAAVKGAHAEQLQVLEARALGLQARCEALELQLRRAEWRQVDALKEKDAAMDKLREDASALKSGWDAQIAQLSKEMISKDLQLQSLQEEEVELKAHLARCQQDIGRYKQQLSAAAERERCLEREKVQLELDWRQRCDGVERDHYRKSEDLIQALTEARDQVAAKLQETERTLRGQEVVLKALTLERDQAVQALRTQGLLPEREVQMLLRHHEEEIRGSFPSSEIQRLQEQNTSLRRAVSEMRKEMETLSDLVLPPAPSGGQSSDTEQPRPSPEAAAEAPDHVTVLETEIRNLKHKFKTLEEQVEDVLDPSKRPSSYTDFQPSVCISAGVPGKPPRHPLPTPEAQNMSVAPEAPLGQLQPHSAAQRQHRISTVTCRSTRHKENRSPKPRPAQESHRESGHRTGSSSSAASGPLQDTWKLLDLGSSPSGLTSQDDSAPAASPRPIGPLRLRDRPYPSSEAGYTDTSPRVQNRSRPCSDSRDASDRWRAVLEPVLRWEAGSGQIPFLACVEV
ncbi:coiled-coil domain-containing protein 57 isoform X5 [Neomonachus schauinslandi]|uniref:Coiled-coil domain-containing protein 57 isoform X5 n=1 Tax=Neomonachus schauinslandi TaxID=29088 RepID=A0A8M1MZ38_NEOSC|nr:coiled-coil domain-containing protein 57 isoform X5 [Neomonachus schauinslandi]